MFQPHRVLAAGSATNAVTIPSGGAAGSTVAGVGDLSIACPPAITIPQGSYLCDNGLTSWLESATATSSCEPVTLSHDAPPCGFSPDSVNTVTFSATDHCGHSMSCMSTVTVEPLRRVDVSKKGSVLVFPAIEVKWDARGRPSQDTFITFVNDYPQDVYVHSLFVNGDDTLAEQVCCNPPNIIERRHQGWTKQNWTTTLTQNQPTYFSVMTGAPKGAPPFSNLDNGPEGPGRPDIEAGDGSRYLRGFLIAWAVDQLGHEISWNHLSGSATVVDYRHSAAWSYSAYAFQSWCVAHGEEPLDCTEVNPDGICCEASVIPGNLDLDGFQYDIAFDALLLDFFSIGSMAFSTPQHPTSMITDLTLLPLVQDMRQNSDGPVITLGHFDVWNQREDYFSGSSRCVTSWDQFLLSDLRGINYFWHTTLQTDVGKARIRGITDSAQCGAYSQDAPLLGVVAKSIEFSDPVCGPVGDDLSGRHLVGMGQRAGWIAADVVSPPDQAGAPDEGSSDESNDTDGSGGDGSETASVAADLCIIWSTPPSGAVDARREQNPEDHFAEGIESVRLAFSEAVRDPVTDGNLVPENFILTDPTGNAPEVLCVRPVDGCDFCYDVIFTGPITPGVWTTMIADVVSATGSPISPDPCDRIDLGFLPGDANGDLFSGPVDILHVVDCLNGVAAPACPLWECDIDRNGTCAKPDILREVDLLNGVWATRPWWDVTLPPQP